MKPLLSEDMRAEILRATKSALANTGLVNVPIVAEGVRRRNLLENIALEDVEYAVLQLAQQLGAAIEFDASPMAVLSLLDTGGGAPAINIAARSPARD